MKLNPDNLANRRRRSSGFTLAEVLAALLLLAIVIPVALQGLSIASRAGEVGQRKMVAARIGNKVINELKVTGQLQSSGQSGTVIDHGISYKWTVKSQPWSEDNLSHMTVGAVTVSFLVQGKSYEINLSTLCAPPTSASSTPNSAVY